jgi:hypothetical protein
LKGKNSKLVTVIVLKLATAPIKCTARPRIHAHELAVSVPSEERTSLFKNLKGTLVWVTASC